MYNATRSWSFALVSADYRLAPQAGIEEMLDDVQDCIGFIRDPAGLAATLPKGTVDINRLAVSSTADGGYLALLAGIYVYPKPQAVLAISPITDPLGSSFRTSRTWDKLDRKGLSTTDAQAALKPLLDRNGQVVSNSEDMPDRKLMFKYMLARGNLAELLHLDTTNTPPGDFKNKTWRIAKQIRDRGLPPTFIFHGEEDDQVVVAQSDEVIGALRGVLGHDKFEWWVQYERVPDLTQGCDDVDIDYDSDEDSLDSDASDDPDHLLAAKFMHTMYNFFHSFV